MKKIVILLLSTVLTTAFVGCSSNESSSSTPTPTQPPSQTEVPETTEAPEENNEVVEMSIAALKGPTAMGMVKLMSDSDASEEDGYSFSLHTSVDEITPKLVSGELDIAAVPSNMASVLHNNTNGQVQVLAINTLGVLYIAENGDTVKSLNDLEGKTIYASGKGATPEYTLSHILEQNNLLDKVKIEWKSEHAECVTALVTDPSGVAMLPEPFITTAKKTAENIRTAVDLTAEWDALGEGSQAITGVLVGNRKFIEENKEAVDVFLDDYEESVAFTESNLDDAAKLIGEYGIVPEPVAKVALPKCNIAYIDGEDMKVSLSGYLQVLFDSNPKSVGGKMPSEDFYYAQ